jgi:hypothetical protein
LKGQENDRGKGKQKNGLKLENTDVGYRGSGGRAYNAAFGAVLCGWAA